MRDCFTRQLLRVTVLGGKFVGKPGDARNLFADETALDQKAGNANRHTYFCVEEHEPDFSDGVGLRI